MRIVFDCRYTRTDRHDGVSRFTSKLVEALAGLQPVTMLISDYRQLAMLPDLPWEMVSAPTSIREPLVALQVNRLKPDVVFSPMQTMGSWGRRYRLVLTVHDLIYYRHRTPPAQFSWPIRLLWRLYHLSWWPQRWLLSRADEIVVVSDTTGSLLAEHALTSKPVTVVHNAADVSEAAVSASASAGNRSGARSLVYMGSYMAYKNVESLARALHLLPGYTLHLMSRISDADRRRLAAVAPAGQLVFHNGASDEEYLGELARATALLSASKDEGFGIPLVESMALGTPIAVSDIPIFREIGGEAALFFDPTDERAIAHAVRTLENADEWARRSAASLEQAQHFTWQRSAQRLLKVLESAAHTR